MKLLWIFIVFVAGSFLPIQAGLNSKMAKAIDKSCICFDDLLCYWRIHNRYLYSSYKATCFMGGD